MMRLLLILVLVGVGVTIVSRCGQSTGHTPLPVQGVKIYGNRPEFIAAYGHRPEAVVEELKDLHINTVFAPAYEGNRAYYPGSQLLVSDTVWDVSQLRATLRSAGIDCGAICQIFYDPVMVANRPELIPIDQHGSGRYSNWQKMVCPSDSQYRNYKLAIVEEVVDRLQPDWLCLDFIRFPVTWEEVGADTEADQVRHYCFCPRCLQQFSARSGVRLPYPPEQTELCAEWIVAHHRDVWRVWKTELVTDFVRQVNRILRRRSGAIRLMVHYLPWPQSKFDRGVEWMAGQSALKLARWVDALSPMLYHELIGMSHQEAIDLIRELGRQPVPIITSIQAAPLRQMPDAPFDAQFSQLVAAGMSSPSGGVILFHWGKLMRLSPPDAIIEARRRFLQTRFQP